MRFIGLAVILTIVASLGTPVASAREGQNLAPFDRPIQTRHVTVRPSPSTPGEKQEIRCFTFAHLMVKEIDAGEIGDEQISILPLTTPAAPPPCQVANAAGERVIPADNWSGYFLGAKDDYVFLSAEDGVNGGLGFSVYQGADPNSVFQDAVRFKGDHVSFQSIANDAAGLRMHYTRLYTAACSVPTEGAPCWARIAAETHLPPAPAPDCAAGYRRAKQDLATARCAIAHHKDASCVKQEMQRMQADNASPSVIGYAVDALIQHTQKSIQPTGGPVACWPAD